MNPDNWPSPPLSYYVLENPWLLCGTVLVAGALLAVHGRRTGNKKLRTAGIAAIVVSMVVMLTALLVTTDRELMARRTRDMVNAAVAPVRLDVFRNTLSREVRLFDRDYDQIIAALETTTSRWAVDQVWITNLLTHQQDTSHGRTYLSLITRGQGGFGGGSIQTRWLLHWVKEDDGRWRVVRIEWVSLGDAPATPGDLP